MRAFRRLIEAIEAEGSAALVTLARVEGSSPREEGARMVVRPSGGFHGTIGGGALEFAALDAAQAALRRGRGPAFRRSLALGPELGQCCGGRVEWRVETFDTRDVDDLSALAIAEGGASAALSAGLGPDGRVQRALGSSASERKLARLAGESWTERLGVPTRAVYLFGAGHVGRALALALAPLPFAVRWIDPRRDAFPAHTPANVTLIHAPEPAAELASAPDGALVVVMTHSHALDLEIIAEALKGRALRLRRPDRFVDQAGALPEPDARGRPHGGPARPPRLPDRDPGSRIQGSGGDRRLDRRAASDRQREPGGGGG